MNALLMNIVTFGTILNFQTNVQCYGANNQPGRLQYSRDFLIECGKKAVGILPKPSCIPPEIYMHGAANLDVLTAVRARKCGREGGGQVWLNLPSRHQTGDSRQQSAVRKRKRGRRGGVRQRLRRRGLRRLPLPSIILGNVQSLRNKIDELQAHVKSIPEYKNACVIALTETWLKDQYPSHDYEIDGFGQPIRLDRDEQLTAFNCMQPHILAQRLSEIPAIDVGTICWLVGWLTRRPQRVRVNGTLSEALDHEVGHGPVLDSFIEWCEKSFLQLNVAKTKDMRFDFRRKPPALPCSIINGSVVETVSQYKYLGTILDDKLTFEANTDRICKKWQMNRKSYPWAYFQELMSWARMNFKPAKSRSLVLKKGKVTDKFHFSLGTTKIPSLTEEPVKSLGKVFKCSLRDAASIKATNQDLEAWLAVVDKSGLPGKFKAWIYQHGILPRILWPLLVYEVPISTVESFEMRISRFLRRWLGLPRSLSSIALYGRNNKLKLPMSSLSEEFMVTRSREVLQYRDSSDPKVAQAGIEVRTGRKWRAAVAVDDAESRLRQKVLVGSVAQGRAGLGSRRTPRYDKAEGKERRSLILEEVRAGVEEKRACQMAGMRQQGAWTRWEQTVERKVTWTELWKAEPYRIKFLIQAVYDVLPSPSNLFSWGMVETPACPLCQRRGTLEHILSCCPKALGEGRYRWRHDQVLKAVADSICSGISHSKSLHPVKTTAFVRAGEKSTPAARGTSSGLLATARDWELSVDLGKQLKFPETVAITTLRPDIVLTSEASKQVIILELTVPWEDRMEEANERKRAKYSQLMEGCRNNGWRAICQPVEVGCRGFVGQSLCRAYKMLGITGASQRRAIKLATDAAEVASRWLWIRRGEVWRVG
ncbi:uncharacterized protein [Garra rufa]|uniref:uncharacterized protein n=1 Tax=Garra rufa TaxID=137080 RepID=UPI003CCE9739